METVTDYFHLAASQVRMCQAAIDASRTFPIEPTAPTRLSIAEIRLQLSLAYPDIWLSIQHLSGSLPAEVWHAIAHLMGRAETQLAISPEDL